MNRRVVLIGVAMRDGLRCECGSVSASAARRGESLQMIAAHECEYCDYRRSGGTGISVGGEAKNTMRRGESVDAEREFGEG